jgi:hypothetical protein
MRDAYLDDEFHLAQMVSLMGPPPKQFLERSEQCGKYWDSGGMGFLSHVRGKSMTDKQKAIGSVPFQSLSRLSRPAKCVSKAKTESCCSLSCASC